MWVYLILIGAWKTVVRVLAGPEISSVRYWIQTGNGTHPASYPVDTECAFRGDKVAGA
jgi:hypothetical protein